MKPGDIIEWAYKYSEDLVDEDENLWSEVEGRFVTIGGEMVHILVSINDKTYSWLNAKGLFHARVEDSLSLQPLRGGRLVVPRTRANP